MFEFICKDYHDSFYYLSSLLLLPMLRLSHLWPLGVLFVQAALVPFHEKWSVESLLRVLTVISTVSFQWTELGTGQNWETGSTCLSMYLSTYLINHEIMLNLNLCFLSVSGLYGFYSVLLIVAFPSSHAQNLCSQKQHE